MSKKQKIIAVLFILFCSFFQILPVIKSGLRYNFGLGFWGPNGHDGVWHLALINHISNPFKIEMPTFAGEFLKNYHPFFDILVSFLSKIVPVGSSFWLFQLMPLIISVTFLFLSFLLGLKVTRKFSGGIILVFLNTFANSFGWIVTLIRSGQLGGESIFWAMQSISNQLNPPFALSLIPILFLLIIIIDNPQFKINFKNSVFIFLILFLTPVTKVYGGIIVFFVFGLYSFFALLKRQFYPFKLLLISSVFSFLLFNVYNSGANSLLIYKPFWFINSLIESPDRLYIPYLANMRYALESSGVFSPRLIILQFFGFILFVLGNFSWRVFGFFEISRKDFFSKILFFTVFLTILLPTFFIQKGTSWNTIQFLYYGLFLSNILLTLFLIKIGTHFFGKILILIIFITSFIASLSGLSGYIGNNPPAFLSNHEIDCLNYLSKLSKGTVLTVPYNPFIKKDLKAPIPLYAYETTSYVAAFSKQKTFLEDEMNLDITGYNWQKRREESIKFFNQKSLFEDRGFLINNKIKYIYLINDLKINLNIKALQIDKIFDNSQCQIYQVQR